jgi:hypothetical protein
MKMYGGVEVLSRPIHRHALAALPPGKDPSAPTGREVVGGPRVGLETVHKRKSSAPA